MRIRRRCKCGCGKLTRPGNKYIFSHSLNNETNVFLTYNNKTMSVAEWAKKIGLKRVTIFARIRYGMPIERILSPKELSIPKGYKFNHAKYPRPGEKNYREYGVWASMLSRCKCGTKGKKGKGHKNYSGRGIKVCIRWRVSFKAFIRDMGSRPTKKHTIDRIDNNGNYTPNNCRWATRTEQMSNTRQNHLVTIGNETLTVTNWIRRLGIRKDTFYNRVNNLGWSDKKALTTPWVKWKHENKWKDTRK